NEYKKNASELIHKSINHPSHLIGKISEQTMDETFAWSSIAFLIFQRINWFELNKKKEQAMTLSKTGI
ncbi:MAG: hypothetical protein JO131_01205, partial [Gammaproteobacteria bacterium]|nr:hypothetical protein [Gammaproteobacteria bacterium]